MDSPHRVTRSASKNAVRLSLTPQPSSSNGPTPPKNSPTKYGMGLITCGPIIPLPSPQTKKADKVPLNFGKMEFEKICVIRGKDGKAAGAHGTLPQADEKAVVRDMMRCMMVPTDPDAVQRVKNFDKNMRKSINENISNEENK